MHKKRKSELARKFFKANPFATAAECVREIGVSRNTAQAVRSAMRTKQAATPDTMLPADQEKLESVSAADLMHKVHDLAGTESDDLPPDKMKRILSRIANDPLVAPQVRIMAVTAKQRLDFDTQERHDLGPGPPMTRAAAVERMSWLIEAVGPSIVEDAITRAFTKKGPPNGSSSETAVSGETGTPPSQPPEQPEGPTVDPSAG